MGTVTLGVSIAVPEPYGSLLQERRAGFGDPAAHGIPTHVTLVPPTAVDAERLPLIEAHLAAVAADCTPFAMRLRGTGTFRPLSPVVFVKLTQGVSGCNALQQRIRDEAGPLVRELQFPYHPHVTVAHGISEEAMDRAFRELSGYEAAWTCRSFALYEQGADAVWRKLHAYEFGRGRPVAGVPVQGSPVDTPTPAAG
ncbi:2'-5' RNA ligase family protein [Streptomyces sp. ms191]|uniref:2'-5' RNA ligase family protein n=1 Tax=unclassified Streptomyces TaxID=2593676 RepID=UPI0011CD834E|nr:2'-5' RNA ligase family protein [Streptomyces sp. ms191]TXS20694.1 2'-5' RNA ligase family protein [Streptomyces sp. ms191]